MVMCTCEPSKYRNCNKPVEWPREATMADKSPSSSSRLKGRRMKKENFQLSWRNGKRKPTDPPTFLLLCFILYLPLLSPFVIQSLLLVRQKPSLRTKFSLLLLPPSELTFVFSPRPRICTCFSSFDVLFVVLLLLFSLQGRGGNAWKVFEVNNISKKRFSSLSQSHFLYKCNGHVTVLSRWAPYS